jgi:hypothetical protein
MALSWARPSSTAEPRSRRSSGNASRPMRR